MVYLDTSFLAPLVVDELSTAAIQPFVAGLSTGEAAISAWTMVEFASLLARAVRIGRFDERAARSASKDLDALVETSFDVVLPGADDYALARDYVGNFATGLRGPDALHLAVARNRGASAIYSLDKGLLRAGRLLGLPVATGVDLPGYDV